MSAETIHEAPPRPVIPEGCGLRVGLNAADALDRGAPRLPVPPTERHLRLVPGTGAGTGQDAAGIDFGAGAGSHGMAEQTVPPVAVLPSPKPVLPSYLRSPGGHASTDRQSATTPPPDQEPQTFDELIAPFAPEASEPKVRMYQRIGSRVLGLAGQLHRGLQAVGARHANNAARVTRGSNNTRLLDPGELADRALQEARKRLRTEAEQERAANPGITERAYREHSTIDPRTEQANYEHGTIDPRTGAVILRPHTPRNVPASGVTPRVPAPRAPGHGQFGQHVSTSGSVGEQPATQHPIGGGNTPNDMRGVQIFSPWRPGEQPGEFAAAPESVPPETTNHSIGPWATAEPGPVDQAFAAVTEQGERKRPATSNRSGVDPLGLMLARSPGAPAPERSPERRGRTAAAFALAGVALAAVVAGVSVGVANTIQSTVRGMTADELPPFPGAPNGVAMPGNPDLPNMGHPARVPRPTDIPQAFDGDS